MVHFLSIGIILGLSAGFAPGPLLALVISETVQHGARSGIRVALAPVITDLPIIVLTLFVLSRLAGFHTVLGIISLVGGCFIMYMGYGNFQTSEVNLSFDQARPRSLVKGVLANVFSPHPYLFWFSVGGPIVTRAMEQDILAAAAFVAGFYILLVGSKMFLALVVGRSRSFLKGRVYRNTMRVLGLVLCGLALVLFRDGLNLLGIL